GRGLFPADGEGPVQDAAHRLRERARRGFASHADRGAEGVERDRAGAQGRVRRRALGVPGLGSAAFPPGSSIRPTTPGGSQMQEFPDIPLLTRERLPFLRSRPKTFWAVCFVTCVAVTALLSARETDWRKFFGLCGVLIFAALVLVPSAFHFCHETFV